MADGQQAQWSDYARPGPYTTTLAPDQEQQFKQWVTVNKIPWQDSPTSDYDMRGYWQAQQAGDPNAKRAANLHFPDTWKTPYHQTFSNESKYALPTAGHWEGQRFIAPRKMAEELAQPLPLPPDMTNAPPLPTGVSPDQTQMQQAEAQPAAIPPPRPPGTSGLAQQAPSRGDIFRNMLGDFLYSAGKGLAAAGHGPEANARGAGEAITAVHERNVQQQMIGIQQQQAQAMQQYRAAQAESLTPSIKMTDPQGNEVMVPPAHVGQALAAQYRLSGQLGSAAIRGQASQNVAETQATNRMDVEKMKAQLAAGQISRIVPVMGENGKPDMMAINKYGKPLGVIDGAIPPTSYLPKITSTVEYKQMDDGSIVALPKTTVTRPGVGGGGGGGGTASAPVTDKQGVPLIGKGAVTGTTRTMVETAPKVTDLVERTLKQIDDLEKSGDLGPGMSRWNEFWSGKVGEQNPKFRALMTNTTLLSTLLMRMHMGARGGQQIMQHFDEMIGAGHQSPSNLKAVLNEIKVYADDVKSATPLPANYGKSNKGGTSADPVQSLIDKYKPK